MIAASYSTLDCSPAVKTSRRSSVSREQLRDRVMGELSRLDRLIIVLHYYEQLSTREMAQVLEMPEQQIELRRMGLAERLARVLQG
ncbi:MAG: sigma-70 family RNA polymerase sigma factor [Phycisphaeraceae bacterium]|nr:sigma-70 family RNA polymerase sigma factor [Phycisphaeraceae bacterium]